MQKNNAKKKNQPTPVYKPYLKGNPVSALAAKRGLKVLGLILVFAFFGVLASGVFGFDSIVLRVALNGILLLFGAGLMYNEGARQGENDVTFAEIALNRQNEGKEISKTDRDTCFHPLKGWFTALVGVAPFLLITVVYALIATRQHYALGALPSWVSAYEGQQEIGGALAYYHQGTPAGLEDFLRLGVRLLLFPYMNMLGAGNYDRLYLLDKLSPLLLLIVPACYGLGYLRGPQLRALVHGNIRMARRRRNRSERKAREKRAQKTPQKKELI